MILRAFALRDVKAGIFWTPFFYPTVGQARRAIVDMMADHNLLVARHPEDFSLFEVGTWDDELGRFHQEEAPLHVCECTHLLPRDIPTPLDGRV